VRCHWYRRHRTLWRLWWIWPSYLSPPPWNLTTVRGSVNAKIFIYWFWSFNKLLFCRFHPHFLSATKQGMLNKQAILDSTVLLKRHQHCVVCSFSTEKPYPPYHTSLILTFICLRWTLLRTTLSSRAPHLQIVTSWHGSLLLDVKLDQRYVSTF
jgi:hypothetical protein